MGAGDWLMATAQVKQLYARAKRPVAVVDRARRLCWHEVFENNPKISKRVGPMVPTIINAGGCRPYIAGKNPKHWTWKRWNIEPGEIYLSDAENAFAAPHAGAVLIEPSTKIADSNKAWIWERWQELVDRGGRFIQVGPEGTRELRGVERVVTPTFRDACAILSVSRAFVGTEGGLHHAAAALGRPAVVLFSEFISPDITGYKSHRNLRHATEMCGARVPCASCRRSMEAITVDEVERNLREVIK